MGKAFEVSRDGYVATVGMTGPTIDPPFFDDLDATFRELAVMPDLRAVVLHGCEKAFSYGLDLAATIREHGKIIVGANLAGPRMELLALIHQWQGVINRVAGLPVPVIAAVHRWCVGGGLDLIAACDIRLASADTRFSLREGKVAMVADLGSLQRLPGIIGQGNTRELAYTAKDIDADRALHMGLVNGVYPDREATIAAARAMAEEIAANSPLAVRGIKQVMAFGEGKPISEGLAYVAAWNSAFVASEDLGEAAAAFVSKRPAKFKGR